MGTEAAIKLGDDPCVAEVFSGDGYRDDFARWCSESSMADHWDVASQPLIVVEGDWSGDGAALLVIHCPGPGPRTGLAVASLTADQCDVLSLLLTQHARRIRTAEAAG